MEPEPNGAIVAPSTQDGAALGRRFVDAIVRRDWDALRSCLDPDIRFSAVIPKDNPFRQQHGAADTTAQLQAWFRNADTMELLDSDIDVVADRVKIAYRIREHEPDGWHLVEQVAYATPGAQGFRFLNLVCSGFRPVDD